MRALLLILIGGGLIWLLIQGFGSGLAKEPDHESSGGTLLHEDGAARSAASAQDEPATGEAGGSTAGTSAAQSSGSNSAAPAPLPSAPAQPPAAAPIPTATDAHSSEAAPAASSAAKAGAEIEISARLLHQTAGFLEWLDSAKPALPEGRLEFAKALGLQLNGRSEEAGVLAHRLADSKDLGDEERKLIGYWPQGPTFAVPAGAASSGASLLRAAGLASLAQSAQEALGAARWQEAARAYSKLMLAELESAWDPDQQCLAAWAESLQRAQHGYRWSKKGVWPALELKVAPGESLISIRKRALQERPELITCTGLIARANQLQGETIQPGQSLRIPAARPRVLVDLSARWLFFMQDDEVVGAWQVGIGKPGSETPPGVYRIGEKSADPTWFRAGQPPVPAGDPRNPLGTRWLAWVSESGEKTHLGIHGTRDPESIGQDESEGCVRMLNRHVEELYEVLPRGTEVLVRP
jgi:L,D-transpeptidase catalytic domain